MIDTLTTLFKRALEKLKTELASYRTEASLICSGPSNTTVTDQSVASRQQ